MLEVDQSNVTTLSLPLQGAPNVKANVELPLARLVNIRSLLSDTGPPGARLVQLLNEQNLLAKRSFLSSTRGLTN